MTLPILQQQKIPKTETKIHTSEGDINRTQEMKTQLRFCSTFPVAHTLDKYCSFQYKITTSTVFPLYGGGWLAWVFLKSNAKVNLKDVLLCHQNMKTFQIEAAPYQLTILQRIKRWTLGKRQSLSLGRFCFHFTVFLTIKSNIHLLVKCL